MLTYRIVSARLPFHPQHRFDEGTYFSVGIEYTIDPETGRTNVGCRRLRLRNRHESGTNVTTPEIESNAQYRPILEALESTPMFFLDIMDSVGRRDGREVAWNWMNFAIMDN